MIILTTLSILILLVSCVVYTIGWVITSKKSWLKTKRVDFPSVSILIPVRNEEENIVNLLNSLNQLNYPEEKLEILIGNDQSTDTTTIILEQYASEKIQICNIDTEKNGLSAKMNVLSQLVKKSTGELLLLTDADMNHNASWISGLVNAISKDTGLVGGFTVVRNTGLFSQLQNIEYAINQGLIKALNEFGIPTSIMGNNMMVHRENLEKIGGYESMEFSLVEDTALMWKFINEGYKVELIHHPDSVAITNPVSNYKDLIQQRVRWAKNFGMLHPGIKLIFLLNTMSILAIIPLWMNIPFIALMLLILRIMVVVGFLRAVNSRVGQELKAIAVLLYVFLEPFLYISILAKYISNRKINWKGRSY